MWYSVHVNIRFHPTLILARAYHQTALGRGDEEALDELLEGAAELARERSQRPLAELLTRADLMRLTVSGALALLMGSFHARSELGEVRAAFVRRVEEKLLAGESTRARADKLLQGLR